MKILSNTCLKLFLKEIRHKMRYKILLQLSNSLQSLKGTVSNIQLTPNNLEEFSAMLTKRVRKAENNISIYTLSLTYWGQAM